MDFILFKIAKIKSGEVMNLNEYCLLNFLINPDEITDLSELFLKNLQEIEKNSNLDNN